jgi:hypothetical protein
VRRPWNACFFCIPDFHAVHSVQLLTHHKTRSFIKKAPTPSAHPPEKAIKPGDWVTRDEFFRRCGPSRQSEERQGAFDLVAGADDVNR